VKDDNVYLRHMRDALDRIASYTSAGREAFAEQTVVQDAVLRNLEIVGEASKRVSEQVKVNAPEVPWRIIAGMRDKLIHDYPGVDLDIVWQTVERDLPFVRQHIHRLLGDG
jgi:uncharacterized protein with HEPN domain